MSFAADHLEMKKRGAWIVRFDITDQTNSIRVAKFLVGDEGKELAGAIREGQRLVVQGRVSPYQGELADRTHRHRGGDADRPPGQGGRGEAGGAPPAHHACRSMDATTDIKEVIKRAAAWGHPGHRHHGPRRLPMILPAPPIHAAKKAGIKMIFGVEAYFQQRRGRHAHGARGAMDVALFRGDTSALI